MKRTVLAGVTLIAVLMLPPTAVAGELQKIEPEARRIANKIEGEYDRVMNRKSVVDARHKIQDETKRFWAKAKKEAQRVEAKN